MQHAETSKLKETAVVFLRLGATAFGGPAAHVGIMHDEVVKRRRWLDDQEFLDLLGATNLIPGPNSTEMAIHLGYRRAGWPGLIAGGVGFVMPATLIVLGLAWAYSRFGALPQAGWLLYGVKPVVIGIITQALLSLGRKAVKNVSTGVVAGLAAGLYFLGANEVLLLFAGGLAAVLLAGAAGFNKSPGKALFLPLAGAAGSAAGASLPFSLWALFWVFLKAGAVLYGSGYVLLAFLRSDLVVRYGWLTDAQLLDAIAIGQVTPGPLFTSVTFIGYQLGGLPGALLATLGFLLPSFFFVIASHPFIFRMRQSAALGALLDGVNAASLGLMAGVAWQIGRASLVDPATILIALAALGLLLRFRINSTWLIAGGAIAGWLAAIWR